jgi:hypothetical protein
LGLTALAAGHLSPQILSPSLLQQVIKEINPHLPLGWAIPSDDLWVLYRESKVSVAVVAHKIRLFIEISIFDHAQHFNLFQIITLSKALANGTHGSCYNNLPDYLAVSPDLDIFAELTHLDILKCRSFDKQVCMFHTGFAKRGSRKSCAVALFTNDETHVWEFCQTLSSPGMVRKRSI